MTWVNGSLSIDWHTAYSGQYWRWRQWQRTHRKELRADVMASVSKLWRLQSAAEAAANLRSSTVSRLTPPVIISTNSRWTCHSKQVSKFIVWLSSRTSNALNAPVPSEQVRLIQSALMVGSRMKSGWEFQTVRPVTSPAITQSSRNVSKGSTSSRTRRGRCSQEHLLAPL